MKILEVRYTNTKHATEIYNLDNLICMAHTVNSYTDPVHKNRIHLKFITYQTNFAFASNDNMLSAYQQIVKFMTDENLNYLIVTCDVRQTELIDTDKHFYG